MWSEQGIMLYAIRLAQKTRDESLEVFRAESSACEKLFGREAQKIFVRSYWSARRAWHDEMDELANEKLTAASDMRFEKSFRSFYPNG